MTARDHPSSAICHAQRLCPASFPPSIIHKTNLLHSSTPAPTHPARAPYARSVDCRLHLYQFCPAGLRIHRAAYPYRGFKASRIPQVYAPRAQGHHSEACAGRALVPRRRRCARIGRQTLPCVCVHSRLIAPHHRPRASPTRRRLRTLSGVRALRGGRI